VIARSTSAAGGRVVGDASDAEHLREVLATHQAILEAIRRRDADAAKAAMERSLQDIIEQTLRIMARREREQLARELT
jgi:DNA-binding GntR family transcriptional regulator